MSRKPKPYYSEPLSDLGNARYFVSQHGHSIRYCHAWGKWLVWDKSRWRIDETGDIDRLAKDTVRSLLGIASKMNTADGPPLAKHALKCQEAYRLRALIEMARTEAGIPVTPVELDADSHLLNCANGTLNLRDGVLRAHQSTDLLTKLAPVVYDPKALCPTFDAFLLRIMGADRSLVAYVQRCIGYALTGDVSEKALFVLYGGGDNGKTTLVETIRHVLGEYAGMLPVESLLDKGSGSIPNDIAQLKGLRFVTSSEAEQGRKLAEAKVKFMTGMGTLQARFLYREHFQFTPTFKIFMDSNYKPEVRGTDNAIWNRIKLIPFTVSIPDAEKDRHLLQKLKAEAPGILAWAVCGCLDWRRHGLGEPSSVTSATSAYREEMDLFADFLNDHCERAPVLETTVDNLYRAYENWCRCEGAQPISKKALGQRLGETNGLTPGKLGGKRSWKGIGLRVEPAKAA